MSDPVLRADQLSCGYRRVPIVSEVSFDLASQEILLVLGPNGCGKSTLLKSVVGVLPLVDGRLVFNGLDVSAMPAAKRARRGMAWVPSGGRLFGELTVRENLSIGVGGRTSSADWERRFDLVSQVFPKIVNLLDSAAFGLSGGEQQMVAVGRALMGEPRVLLLDEPSLGLAPALVMQLMDALDHLRDRGLSAVVVEQNAAAGLSVADRAMILGRGRVQLTAAAQALREDHALLARYLTNAVPEEDQDVTRVPAVEDV